MAQQLFLLPAKSPQETAGGLGRALSNQLWFWFIMHGLAELANPFESNFGSTNTNENPNTLLMNQMVMPAGRSPVVTPALSRALFVAANQL